MKYAHRALASVFGFAWKCSVVVIALALLSAMAPDDEGHAHSGSAEPAALKAFGESVRVTLKPGAGRSDSRCMLVDEDGNQLLLASYRKDGELWIQWGDAFPVRPSCMATRDGQHSIVVMDGDFHYSFELRPNGVSGLRAVNFERGDYFGLGFTPDGKRVTDPWAIGEIPSDSDSSINTGDPGSL